MYKIFRHNCLATAQVNPCGDLTFEQLILLLNFIYADDWVAEAEFAFEMIPIADRFSVLDLKRLCERTLIGAMSVDTVARVFALADKYSCNRLRSRALLFMTDSAHFHLATLPSGGWWLMGVTSPEVLELMGWLAKGGWLIGWLVG
eukprot:Skav215322  [mRNA]  locus=scaffold1788:36151:39021:- [translate_table: standard]